MSEPFSGSSVSGLSVSGLSAGSLAGSSAGSVSGSSAGSLSDSSAGLLSPLRRTAVIDALRRGTVPVKGLEHFAVGLQRFAPTIEEELQAVSRGGAGCKAIRGEYGSGKTFAARWITERAKQLRFATSEVQISEGETPLHRMETVYRRIVDGLQTESTERGAFRPIVDQWLYTIEEDVLSSGTVDDSDPTALLERTTELMERRLGSVSRSTPVFATALRAYHRAQVSGDVVEAEGILSWLGGQPNVAASVKRSANVKGEVDHAGALGFLQGLLAVLRDSGHAGLVVVLDEVETLQRVRTDVREKALNALRQFIDEIDAGRFPGLYLVITGTPAFFDGPQGVQRLQPLAQRMVTDFTTDARFDNPRAVQIRLSGFDHAGLVELGRRIRAIYAGGSADPERLAAVVDDAYLDTFATAITGQLGGRVGIAPRLFLKKLVGDVLDRVDQFADFDPRQHYALTVDTAELTAVERNANAGADIDDIVLDDIVLDDTASGE